MTGDIRKDATSVGEVLAGQGKCTRPPAPTAARNVKSLSSQQREDLFIAGNVGRNTNQVSRIRA